MAIYQIRPNIVNYKAFFLIDDDENLDLEIDGYFDFKGKSRVDDWHSARVFTKESFPEDAGKIFMGDIARFNASALAYSEKATEVLRELLEESGELLPFDWDGQKWWVHNVLNIVDVLDYNASKLELLETGTFELEQSVLDEQKLSGPCLFKQKQFSSLMGHDSQENDYKTLVELSKLTGVEFESTP